MNDKRPYVRYLGWLTLFYVSEFCYILERRFGSVPDPTTLHRNIAGTVMSEWMGHLIRAMPDDFQFMDPVTRPAIFKAFMYGCNPLRVASALQQRRNIIPYCLRYNDGIM